MHHSSFERPSPSTLEASCPLPALSTSRLGPVVQALPLAALSSTPRLQRPHKLSPVPAPACPSLPAGAASGRLVFNAEDAEAWHERGEKIILMRTETSPEDVGGMHAAEGIATARQVWRTLAPVTEGPGHCGCAPVSLMRGRRENTHTHTHTHT